MCVCVHASAPVQDRKESRIESESEKSRYGILDLKPRTEPSHSTYSSIINFPSKNKNSITAKSMINSCDSNMKINVQKN